MALLRARQVYVKLSGVYRFSGDNMPGLDDYCREVLRDAPTQVVWGSDRPHPTGPDKFMTPEERLIPQDYHVMEASSPPFEVSEKRGYGDKIEKDSILWAIM